MDETPRNVVDAIVKDGVADQRAKGLIPRTNEVRRYVQGVVERMERRDEENRLRIKPKAEPRTVTKERSTADMEEEYAKRLRRKGETPTPGSWTVTREEAKKEEPSLIEVNKIRNSVQARRMRARLRLLRSKPDWADKLKRINPLALQGSLGPEKQKHATELVREVIRASDQVFGSWMKAPPKKLIFT